MQPAERSIPKPAENEVIIKIKAAGINRPDIAQRQGRYPAPPGVPADVPLESEGVDVILDMVGGDYVPKNIRLLRPAGRMVFINAMKGGEMNLNIRDIIKKRLTITGSTLRNREISFKSALAKEIENHVWPLIEQGKFKPVIYTTFPLEDANKAHELMESSSHIGKIVLVVE